MKALWIVLGVVAVLVIAVVVLVFVGISKVDDVVLAMAERAGSEITGTEVRIEGVDLSLRSGEGSLHGLHVGNPPGFSDRDAFNLDEISFQLNLASLRGESILIDEVRVLGPRALVELNDEGRSNLDVIRANIERHRPPRQEGAPESGGGDKRLQVAYFVTEGGQIRTDATALGGGSESLDLPQVELRDIGGSRGATPDELGSAILEALNDQVVRAAVEQELGRLLKDQGGLKGLLERLK